MLTQFIQGTLDVLILRALAAGPRHGYAIARWVRESSGDGLAIEEGALYHALHRMERRGWLLTTWGVSEANRKAKFYRLSAAGARELERQASAWRKYAALVTRVLGPDGSGR